jgi:hypothetical protein
MRKIWKYRSAALVASSAAGLLFIVALETADARPQYKAEFETTYEEVAKKNGKDGKLTCTVCHPEQDKKIRNNYGEALGGTLGKKNVKDKADIGKAFEEAAKKDSAVKGKTFGALLAEGKLPASTE